MPLRTRACCRRMVRAVDRRSVAAHGARRRAARPAAAPRKYLQPSTLPPRSSARRRGQFFEKNSQCGQSSQCGQCSVRPGRGICCAAVLLWPALFGTNSLALNASGKGVCTATAGPENALEIIQGPWAAVPRGPSGKSPRFPPTTLAAVRRGLGPGCGVRAWAHGGMTVVGWARAAGRGKGVWSMRP